MTGTMTMRESRQLMRLTQSLCRPSGPEGLLADSGVVADLSGLFQADFLGSTRWNSGIRAFENARCVGRDDAMSRQYVERYQFLDPISPVARHRRHPTLALRILPHRDLVRTTYYCDFLLPFQTVDGLDLYLYQGVQNVGDLRIWRAPGRPPMGEREVMLLSLLKPYLLNAFLGFSELASTGSKANLVAAEDCHWPCFDHAPDGHVRAANPAAEYLVGELSAHDFGALRGSICHVARTGRPSTWGDFTLCVARAPGGSSSLIQLVPMFDATGSADELRRRFKLTPREAEVCLLAANGRTDKQLAAALGISYWTVRTHLRKLFTKFDVVNRVELARVLVAR